MATRFALIPASGIDTNESGKVTGRPLKSITVGTTSGTCGYRNDSGFGATDSDFTGSKANGIYAVIVNASDYRVDRMQPVYIVTDTTTDYKPAGGSSIGNAVALRTSTTYPTGESCAETIDGAVMYFKKYTVDIT